jgi:hypothetical protein
MRIAMKVLTAATLLLSLGACNVYREATTTRLDTGNGWRGAITSDDSARLRRWRKAWDEALPVATQADPATIAREGALFEPDQAQPDPIPPAGDYRCRIFKLGSHHALVKNFTPYPWGRCHIGAGGDVQAYDKLDGQQRPHGLILKDTSARAVFLGTLVLGDETAALRYGLDSTRDMLGYVERIGDKRWRLVLPYPHFESTLDVIELIPA